MTQNALPVFPRRPPRLGQVFARYDPPLYFVTFCTAGRARVLACSGVHEAFGAYARRGQDECGVAVGRYVIMPDHVHLFVSLPRDRRLTYWVRGLKRALLASLNERASWQQGFFDHLVRNSESYGEKWNYVRSNPVRAGLVARAEDWPYQGEVVRIDRV